jgi:hypothetical protein
VGEGMRVRVGVRVGVKVGVSVAVSLGVRVSLGVGVSVGVGVKVCVGVSVALGVGVGEGTVAVAVSVGVGKKAASGAQEVFIRANNKTVASAAWNFNNRRIATPQIAAGCINLRTGCRRIARRSRTAGLKTCTVPCNCSTAYKDIRPGGGRANRIVKSPENNVRPEVQLLDERISLFRHSF